VVVVLLLLLRYCQFVLVWLNLTAEL